MMSPLKTFILQYHVIKYNALYHLTNEAVVDADDSEKAVVDSDETMNDDSDEWSL